jgi:hypothetical protein
MGVGTRSKAWRFTDLNKDYSVRVLTLFHIAVFIWASQVLSNIPSTSCGPYQDQRYHTPVCFEVPEQMQNPYSFVFALGQLCACTFL